MKAIIVPVDFSTTAANAAEFAGNLAAFYGADLLLYNAYEIPVALSEYAYPVFDVGEMQKAAIHELEILKENTKAKVRGSININIKAEMITLETGLQTLCAEINPSLVVMGLSGKNALTRLIVGSNTIKAIHYLKYPILVVPPKAEFIPIRKIGLACDYKKVVESTPLALLKKIVTDFRAELHVLNVDFENMHFQPGMLKESFVLSEMLKELKPEYHSIESADVINGLNNFAIHSKLDWIVVIPKKHSVVQKIFTRSQTQQLLYHTTIPILCIHE
ncbi:universal stress protein [Ferruginibacter sp.]|uniref:universal stress protein n=1 Tax=Ferruginibacter sp. TaxID=1940288 RepID=UPI00265AD600|nr:universal stress protein [Ferruginibacter sp.]